MAARISASCCGLFDEAGGAEEEVGFEEEEAGFEDEDAGFDEEDAGFDEDEGDAGFEDEAGRLPVVNEAALGDVFEVVFEDAGFEALCCEDGEGRDEDVPREASDVSLNEKTELVLTEPDALADVLSEPLMLSVPERDRLTGAVLLSE